MAKTKGAFQLDVDRLEIMALDCNYGMRELAEAAGVSYSAVCKARSSKYRSTAHTVYKLAAALGVKPSEIIIKEEKAGVEE